MQTNSAVKADILGSVKCKLVGEMSEL